MKTSLRSKLETLSDRLEEINALLADPGTISNQNKFRDLSKEHAQVTPIVDCFHNYRQAEQNIETAQEMMTDPEMRELAEEELKQGKADIESLEHELKMLLLPKDPNDDNNIYLEIRAGTGGDEAALFAGDLYKMYARYAEQRRWQVEVISESPGEHGGYKELILRVVGQGAYSRLKFESGGHRVQRVPETESQGRIHTSACTVAIMAEVPEVEQVEINPNDIKVDTFRASGAGGQHVNKTDSAIRITHLVGSGDRSERIRTYNFPQGRMTDHRINLTLYKLEEILEGNLDLVVDPLTNENQAQLLTALGE